MTENIRNPITTADEQHERDLNRHRGDEQRVARAEAAARLRERGIVARDDDSLEDVVTMLDAVEAFEHAVELRGGDLMVDTPPATEPDDERFVIPSRADGESADEFTKRVRTVTAQLMRDD